MKDMLGYTGEDCANRGDHAFSESVNNEVNPCLGISDETIEKWKHLHSEQMDSAASKDDYYSMLLTSTTSATKIGDAKGKRIGVDKQDQVMGFGAKDVATYCGWTNPTLTVPECDLSKKSYGNIIWPRGYQPSEVRLHLPPRMTRD